MILDIAFRRLEEVFHPDDLNHLHEIADVVWGRDEPMPAAEFEAAKGDAFAIVTGKWRHGERDGDARAAGDPGDGRPPSQPGGARLPGLLRAQHPRAQRGAGVRADGRRDGAGHGPGRGPRRGVRVGGVSERHGAVSAPRQRAQLHAVRQDRGADRLRQPGAQPDAAAGAVPLQPAGLRPVAVGPLPWPAWACSRWRWRRCSNRPG